MAHTVEIQGIKVNKDTGKPLGRPPKDPVKLAVYQELQKKAAVNAPVAGTKGKKGAMLDVPALDDLPVSQDDPTLTDEEVIELTAERFNFMNKITAAACEGSVRSVIISGAGGVGKTYTVEEIVTRYYEDEGIHYETVKGIISPISLYMLLYRCRTKNSVIILDDADNIFWNEDGLSLLKVALDSSSKRKVSWRSQSAALKDDGIPQDFYFEGSMIFITNLDFQAIVDSGKGKLVPHMQALMTRTLYLDLKLHTPREVGLWIDYMVETHGILLGEGLSKEQQSDVLEYIADNRNGLRNLSLRTALKLAALVKMDPENWRTAAKVLELR